MVLQSKQRSRDGRRPARWRAHALAGALLAVFSPGCGLLLGLNGNPTVACDECDVGQVCSAGACLDVLEISAGGSTTCARLSDGSAWCWGLNAQAQCGQVLVRRLPVGTGEIEFSAPELALRPSPVPSLSRVKSIAVGGDAERGHACALTEYGSVWCWGDDEFSQASGAGSGGDWAMPTPIEVPNAVEIEQVHAGLGRTCVIGRWSGTDRHRLWCWGDNTAGRTLPGIKDPEMPSPFPLLDPRLDKVTDLALGRWHACALSGGRVYCWGARVVSACGDGDDLVEISIPGQPVTDIAAGDEHTCAATGAGIYCWGEGFSDQSEAGGACAGSALAPECCATLVPLPGEDPAEAGQEHRLAAGGRHTCASRPDGKLACWGPSADEFSASIPPRVLGGIDPAGIALGSEHACARLPSGVVQCWGSNDSGQLGIGHTGPDELDEPVKWYDPDEAPVPLP